MQNWAGNQEYHAATAHFPRTVEQVQAIVAHCQRGRAVGSRHSFNDIADPAGGDLISLHHLDQVLELDGRRNLPTVTIQAGITYGQLCPALHSAGYALPNLASLPHISVAGACATGTHGSGDTLPSLAASVSALKLVTANGDLIRLSRHEQGQAFDGAVVSLGALGVVTELTLDLVGAFGLEQQVYENLSLAAVRSHFDAITRTAYSTSLFTDWQNERFNQVWIKSRAGDAPLDLRQLGATRAAEPRHPVQGGVAEPVLGGLIDPKHCTPQLAERGPWHTRLPHFRAGQEPSTSGAELQTEYFVPREHAIAALDALFAMRERFRPLIQISEVRTIAADDLWMSPAYGRASVAIHFTWHKNLPALLALLPEIESAIEPFQPRPHWGKLFRMDPRRWPWLYPKLAEFRELLHSLDPEGKFRNPFVDQVLGSLELGRCKADEFRRVRRRGR